MLLTGTFPRILDEKQRFSIPKPVRDELGYPQSNVLFVAPGVDGSLSLYTNESFSKVADQITQASTNSKEGQAFARLFYAQAQRVEIDKQGRVRIPVELANWAQLTKEIVLIGVRDRLELWSKTVWESWFEEKQPQFDDIAEKALIQSAPRPAHTAAETPNQPR